MHMVMYSPTRRELLQSVGHGFGALALAALLGKESSAAPTAVSPHPPKAKRVVQLFMAGAASHLDLFDYKPELVKRNGEASDFGEPVEAFQNGLGPWLKPIWSFQPHGQCGKRLGEPVSELGKVVDELAFIHNVVGKTGVHSQATLLHNTGFQLPGFPGMGSWVSYGLGSMNDNLPTFVVLPDHRGLASNGTKNWDSAFLPAQHSGTVIYPGAASPIADLFPHKQGEYINPASEAAAHALLTRLNRNHAADRQGDSRLEARIRSYELAAKMQLAAPEALDFRQEPGHILNSTEWMTFPRRSTKRSMPGKRQFISHASASRRVGSSNGASGSCRSGRGTTTAFRGETGTRTRTSNATTARWRRGWPAAPRR